jgi:hypothetical protein
MGRWVKETAGPPHPFNLSHLLYASVQNLRSLGRLECPALLSGLLQRGLPAIVVPASEARSYRLEARFTRDARATQSPESQ